MERKIELNFNNLRLGIQAHFNQVARTLNDCYDPENVEINVTGKGIGDFKRAFEMLRIDIAILMCAYADTPETIDNISSKVNLVEIEFKQ